MSRIVATRGALAILAALLVPISGLGASGCAMLGGGSSVNLESGPQNPASQGKVKTKVTKDNNTQVSVTVKHLAPPARLAQGATTYVVWARPLGVPLARGEKSDSYPERQLVSGETETGVYNLGGLKIGKNLDGHLETVTPFRSFELFITPEPSTSVTAPNGERALWTTISKE
jgi:hypothetical protein